MRPVFLLGLLGASVSLVLAAASPTPSPSPVPALVASPSPTAAAEAAPVGESSEPLAAALLKIKSGEAVILDVREDAEVKGGMIEQAIWIPTSEIQSKGPRYVEAMAKLPKDKPVYVYCASGVRAEAFADLLLSLGYRGINLGGYEELTAAGFTARRP